MKQVRMVGFANSDLFQRAVHFTATLMGVKRFVHGSFVTGVFDNLDMKMLAIWV